MVGEVECEPIVGELVGGVASEPIENICTLGEDLSHFFQGAFNGLV